MLEGPEVEGGEGCEKQTFAGQKRLTKVFAFTEHAT